MKKIVLAFLLMTVFNTAEAQVMKKEKDGTYIVNTTTLATDVEGYNGTTPVEVHIKKNKIVKVVPLKSQEGAKYVANSLKVSKTAAIGIIKKMFSLGVIKPVQGNGKGKYMLNQETSKDQNG